MGGQGGIEKGFSNNRWVWGHREWLRQQWAGVGA